MKIFLAQQNYHIGNFEDNARKIIDGIRKAKEAGADLVMFSELCICGYPPRDFLEFNDFINQSYAAIDLIKQHADTIGVLVGCRCWLCRLRRRFLKMCSLISANQKAHNLPRNISSHAPIVH